MASIVLTGQLLNMCNEANFEPATFITYDKFLETLPDNDKLIHYANAYNTYIKGVSDMFLVDKVNEYFTSIFDMNDTTTQYHTNELKLASTNYKNKSYQLIIPESYYHIVGNTLHLKIIVPLEHYKTGYIDEPSFKDIYSHLTLDVYNIKKQLGIDINLVYVHVMSILNLECTVIKFNITEDNMQVLDQCLEAIAEMFNDLSNTKVSVREVDISGDIECKIVGQESDINVAARESILAMLEKEQLLTD